jgi:hypothetical protein
MKVLNELRDLIQRDVGNRGLCTDPERNLINAFPDDFAAACRSLAEHPKPSLAVVTGFYIPTANPPAGETDGPLGALFLARALMPLGIPVTLVTDDFCMRALQAGLTECDLKDQVPLVTLPTPAHVVSGADCWIEEPKGVPAFSHVLAIERVGPSHVRDEVPLADRDRCHTMRGRDITDLMSPVHRFFESWEICDEAARSFGFISDLTTIGIGDGGNEIGMGKIPWEVIDRNIPRGGLVACRIATQHLIVCGVSNWGAYALAAGVAILRGQKLASPLFDPDTERRILQVMVDAGPLVDGVTGAPTATVDGLTWEQFADVLVKVNSVFV